MLRAVEDRSSKEMSPIFENALHDPQDKPCETYTYSMFFLAIVKHAVYGVGLQASCVAEYE